MAICGFGINISANKPIPKMQRAIQNMQMNVRVDKFEFGGRI